MLAGWTEGDDQVGETRIHYYRTGRGDKPPLLLVHGFSDNGLCWTPVARELEDEYDVVMPDMRGHGLSERARPGEDVDMPAELAGLIWGLKLDRPVICGHSMGAMVSYQIVVRNPGIARALALEDPPWLASAPVPAAAAGGSEENPVSKWAKTLPFISREDLLAGYRKDHPSWPEELIEPMCDSKKQLDPAIVDIMGAKIGSPDLPWRENVGRIAVPLLVFIGDPKLGALVTPEVAAEVRGLNPRAGIVAVPGVGHLIRFDGYAAYMEGLRAFLKRIA